MLKNCDLCSGARRDVRKLGRDITAADKDDAFRQALQFQEAFIGDQVLLARNAERHGLGAGGDHDTVRLDPLSSELERIRADKANVTVEGVNPFVGKGFLTLLRYRIGEAALEGHQSRPIERRVPFDSTSAHAPGVISRLGAADHHLLRIATAQGAGAPEGPEVRDGDALWFLSFIDPTTGEPVYSDGTGAGDLGEPHWQRNIMYYAVVPGSHNSVAGQSCSGGDGGDGYEDQCPHKVMVRKIINDPNDPETLLPGSGGYLDAPSGFSVSGMGGPDLEETRLLGTNILSFRVTGDDESVTVDLRANSIDEARKNVPLGSTPLSGQPTTIQRVFTIFPKNSSGEEP